MKDTEDKNTEAAEEKPVDSPPVEEKEKKVRRTASKVRSGKKRTAKTAKAAKARAKRNGASNGTRMRLNPEAKVTKVSGADNPFKEGSGPYKRVEQVLKLLPATVATVRSKASSLKPGTLSTMRKRGLINIGN